jgi:hypothetical protein
VALACALPALAAAAWWWPRAWALAAVAGIALLALDAPMLRYFQKKRGLWFAVRTIPWHWFSHVYSGAAFAAVFVRRVVFRRGCGCASPVIGAAQGVASGGGN